LRDSIDVIATVFINPGVLMMKAIDIGLIQARRAKLTQEMQNLYDAISRIQNKLSDLETAERVFAELSLEGIAAREGTLVVSMSVINSESNPPVRREEHIAAAESPDAVGKPEGIPTIPEMIREAIQHARDLGAPGLRPKELTSYIRGRYWATMPDAAAGPIAWRMFKRGELGKDGAYYSLPQPPKPEWNLPAIRVSNDLLSSVSHTALGSA
jgi:hypothetical protein